ncbi:MAG: hypothetical protein CSB33_02520 [Desulfobacterales bacterium]|nr:MAG: hypothetical protein CSB33_02520 [Desulfobacterales bacterium]
MKTERHENGQKRMDNKTLTPNRRTGRRTRLVAVLMPVGAALALFGGCSGEPPLRPLQPAVDTGPAVFFDHILTGSNAIGDRLAEDLTARGLSREMPLVAASFVDINDLQKSCALGRIVSEQISTRLAQKKFRLIEIKLRRSSIYVKKREGEFMLSRELSDIAKQNDIHAVLVGTYAVTDYSVFISARVVLTSDGTVIAGREYELDRSIVTEALLQSSTGSGPRL